MCDRTKFEFLFWNRHNWFKPYRGHRICKQCYRTESLTYSSQGGDWTWTPRFEDWLKSLESAKKWDKDRYPEDVSDAKAWLNLTVSTKR